MHLHKIISVINEKEINEKEINEKEIKLN